MDNFTHCVIITVSEASNLFVRTRGIKLVVQGSVENSRQGQTQTTNAVSVQKGRAVWGETFTFYVTDLEKEPIRVDILQYNDEDGFEKLGYVNINLNKCPEGTITKGKFELEDAYSGVLLLDVFPRKVQPNEKIMLRTTNTVSQVRNPITRSDSTKSLPSTREAGMRSYSVYSAERQANKQRPSVASAFPASPDVKKRELELQKQQMLAEQEKARKMQELQKQKRKEEKLMQMKRREVDLMKSIEDKLLKDFEKILMKKEKEHREQLEHQRAQYEDAIEQVAIEYEEKMKDQEEIMRSKQLDFEAKMESRFTQLKKKHEMDLENQKRDLKELKSLAEQKRKEREELLSTYSGLLMKKGRRSKSWRPRFVVIESGNLMTYEDSSMKKLKKKFPLNASNVVTKDTDGVANGIAITHQGTSLLLCASSKREREFWMEAINFATSAAGAPTSTTTTPTEGQ